MRLGQNTNSMEIQSEASDLPRSTRNRWGPVLRDFPISQDDPRKYTKRTSFVRAFRVISWIVLPKGAESPDPTKETNELG